MNPFHFIILSLAAYRLTHLVVFDQIFTPIRDLFVTRDSPNKTFTLQGGRLRRFIGNILKCPWCAGLWVSALIIISYHYFETITYQICLLLAIAAIQSLMETGWMKSVGFPEMKESKEETKWTND